MMSVTFLKCTQTLNNFLPPTMNLGQGNVFTGICDSVHTGCVSTRHPPGADNTSAPDTPSGKATVVGSMHPTGMDSCIV